MLRFPLALAIASFVIAYFMLFGGMPTDGPQEYTSAYSDTSLAMEKEAEMSDKTKEKRVIKTEEEWRQLLTGEEYRILRRKGTERAFSGRYNSLKDPGTYVCAACGNVLFSSDTKYNSHSGWPSFWSPATEQSVETEPDNSLGMTRTEVLCARCGSHLGHVFDDGPQPTGQRFCVNSTALDFHPVREQEE